MPLYEYVCGTGHRSESVRSYEERDAPTLCARCGSTCARIPSTFSTVIAPVPGDLSTAKVNDSDSFFDGDPEGFRACFDRPNPLYYTSEKPFLDMGKERP